MANSGHRATPAAGGSSPPAGLSPNPPASDSGNGSRPRYVTVAELEQAAFNFVSALGTKNVDHLLENLRYVRDGSDALRVLRATLIRFGGEEAKAA